ncbi:MAG: insulinase family protein [Clostridiales bacterium]|nr:insulinase family protein [Clostridiales bacterium]
MEYKSYEKVGETVYHAVLDNGLNIYIIQKKGYMKSFACFAANYGGCDLRFKLDDGFTDTPAGIAHFLEHKMFDMPDGNALTRLSENGASANAFTSDSTTAYFFESTDLFEENLKLLLNFVSTPYFTLESVEKEKGIIAQEIRMGEDSPGRAVYVNLLNALLSSHPARISIAGTVESIAGITASTLEECHHVFYNPSNMVLCAAGDFDPQRVMQIAREIVKAPPGGMPVRDYGGPESMLPVRKLIEVNMEVSRPLYMFGAKLQPEKNGQSLYRQILAAELALEAMMGTSSPLYNKLYSKGIINGNFDYGIIDFPEVLLAYVDGEGEEYRAVMDAVFSEAYRIGREGFDKSLFNRIKKASIGGFLRSLNSLENCCISIAEGCFAGYDPMEGLDLINGITSEEAACLVSGILTEDNTALSVVNPQAGAEE